MTKILFVCHGNICRSPMAQYIFEKMVREMKLEHLYEVDSAATSTEEIGNPVYPPAKKILSENGMNDTPHRARQVSKRDYEYFDKIYVMDYNNVRNIMKMFNDDPYGKISLLLENEEIEDPWYTGNYQKVFDLISDGCRNILSSSGRT